MAALDIFKNSAFTMTGMTEAINVVPNNYGRLRQMGLFGIKGWRTRSVSIEKKNGVLNLLPTKQPGSPGTQGTIAKRDLRQFTIPHIPHEDTVLASEVQGVRAFGSESELMAIGELVNEKLETMANKHDITLEHMRWSTLRGILMDADGSTLVDYFTEFGITQKVINFALTTGGTDVPAKILELKRYLETNLLGETMTGVHVFVDSAFFDSLVGHASIKEAYAGWASRQPLGVDYRTTFSHNGVTFEEHIGQATDLAGNVRKFVPANEGIALPLGTRNTFVNYFAPAEFMESVNTVGLPRYAKQERMDFDRGIKIWTESNPLPMVTRPALIVRLTRS